MATYAVNEAAVAHVAGEEGLKVIGWRDVPTTPSLLGGVARAARPRRRPVFAAASDTALRQSDGQIEGLDYPWLMPV